MKRKGKKVWLAVLLILAMIVMMLPAAEVTRAATSYTNAKDFYESTALNGESYHVEMINGTIYYATKAKKSSSSTNLKYRTIGFDIQLSGNGHTVLFTVQRSGGSMRQIDSRSTDTYVYNLYAVEDDVLFNLATKADSVNAKYVLDAAVINVRMDAILTTKKGDTVYGSIEENGKGGFTKEGTIYRLKDSADLKAVKEIFSGHTFESYKLIEKDLPNYLLSVRYAVNGLEKANESCSTTVTVGSGYRLVNYTENGIKTQYVLYANDGLYTTSSPVLKEMELIKPDEIEMRKKGYKLETGKEWITSDGIVFSAGKSYMPKEICSGVGFANKNIYVYANWKPHTYQINYSANTGTGTVAPTKHTYDVSATLAANTFRKPGYTLESGKEWNTKADGTGISYGSGEIVKNLTDSAESITLYANWKPVTVMITTDKQGGSGGTDSFYEKYGAGFFSDSTALNKILGISLPSKPGFQFTGYFAGALALGTPLIAADGTFVIGPTYFLKDSTVYAGYDEKLYTITFDKQGGYGGSDSVSATYGELLPPADAPSRDGYTFKGYYTGKNRTGDRFYNEHMASEYVYEKDGNTTVYAAWEDESVPEVVLNVSCEKWTNQKVTLTANAKDMGSGLSSVQIYRIGTEGALQLVAEAKGLNGVHSKAITFENETEGVVRYKAVATDMEGHTAESYNVVYYDITPPSGEVIKVEINGTTFYFEIDITDANPGD